jgi:hypothetical protein
MREGDGPVIGLRQVIKKPRQQLKTVRPRIEPLQPLGSILSSSPSTNLMTSAARRRGEQQRLSGGEAALRARGFPHSRGTAADLQSMGKGMGPKLKAKKNQAISIVMGGHPSAKWKSVFHVQTSPFRMPDGKVVLFWFLLNPGHRTGV